MALNFPGFPDGLHSQHIRIMNLCESGRDSQCQQSRMLSGLLQHAPKLVIIKEIEIGYEFHGM